VTSARARVGAWTRRIVQHQPARPAYAAGLRASLVTTAPVVAALVLGRPELAWMAIGAWLVTLCDVGGAYSTRARAMATMTVAGGVVRLVAGAAGAHFGLAVLLMLGFGTGFSLLRVLGDVGAKVGSLLVVMLALALGARDHELHTLTTQALLFAAGGLVSMTLALLFWGVHPYKPARRAVSAGLGAVAESIDALLGLLGGDAEKEAWNAWIRTSPRRVRAAIEVAQAALFATRRGRIGESTTGDRLQVVVEQIEGIFVAVIALGDQIEHGAERSLSLDAEVARSLAAIVDELRRLSDAAIAPQSPASAQRLGPALAEIETDVPSRGAIRRTIVTIAQRLEIIAAALALLPGAAPRAARPEADREDTLAVARRSIATLRAHLAPGSHAFRHAARVGITTATAMLVVKLVPVPHGPWAVLAAAVSLQPSNAATWSRTIQRVAGTAAGAALVALVVVVAPHPAAMIALIAVTIFAGVALLPLSYFYFAFFITPAFVLFAELAERRHDLASARALDTLIGGALAIVGASLFWRRADDQRLDAELAVSVERSRVFLRRALARLGGSTEITSEELAEARRQIGLANNNAEDTLQQLVGAGGSPRYEALAVVLTYLRRITATTINVLASREVPEGPALAAFAARIDAALAGVRASLEAAAIRAPGREAASVAPEPSQREAPAIAAEGLPEPLCRVEIFVGEMRRRLVGSA
jgi:uncharacterized membrane protein YccC